MRYEDWDVLLFPAGEEQGAHVPVKEFKTACYVEAPVNSPQATPLLTSFIPCLTHGAPFQISVHSWNAVNPKLAEGSVGSSRPRELVQIQIVIDGKCVGVEHFSVSATWPQIISSSSPAAGTVESQPLRFPPFHRSIVSQNHWDPSDKMGRIRVELTQGYVDERLKCYIKLCDIVTFAFQAAPLDLLQRSGIAWPNGRMVTNPLQANAYLGAAAVANAQMVNGHKRVPSGNGTMAIAGMNAQLPSPPIHLYTHDQNAKFDAMSRSTSAYSAISDSAGPLMYKNGVNPVFTGMPVNAEPKNQPVSFRMTSDQLQSIINAIRSPQEQQAISSSTTMPPPPIPTHAVGSKDLPSDVSSALPQFSASKPTFGSDALNFANKGARAESRYSDISMHAGCNGFPSCTSEDCDGHIVHNAPNAPATVVRGRKEGSSPTKPRDFFSTILDTTTTAPPMLGAAELPQLAKETTTLLSSSPADTTSKKRTRSALRLLNSNDSSPEKGSMAKPPRKVSRASFSSSKSNKENTSDEYQDQENMI